VAVLLPDTGALFFLQGDRLDTPQFATDSSARAEWKANYQPFGAVGPVILNLAQNLRLPGQYADQDTGYYHNGFRDYDPSLGRYVQSDPIGLLGGLNAYAYAGGNPLRNIDPLGLAALSPDQCKKIQEMLDYEKTHGTWDTASHFSNTWPHMDTRMGEGFNAKNVPSQYGDVDLDWFTTVIQHMGDQPDTANGPDYAYDWFYIGAKSFWNIGRSISHGRPYGAWPYADPGEANTLDLIRNGIIHFSDLFPPDFLKQNCPCLK
jgi:RHS repeat-associated protein